MLCQYDIRSAEKARERLQGSEISGRPVSELPPSARPSLVLNRNQIDVHYSLPRDDHGTKGADKDRNQVCGSPPCIRPVFCFDHGTILGHTVSHIAEFGFWTADRQRGAQAQILADGRDRFHPSVR